MKNSAKSLLEKEWFQVALIILVLTAVTILLAMGHAIAKKTEAEFVKKFSTEQMSFEDYSSFDEATAALQVAVEKFLTTPIHWTAEPGEIDLSPLELGATASLGEIEQYFANFEDLPEIKKIAIWFFGKELENPLNVDLVQMKAAFEGSGIEQGNKSASYNFSSGKVAIEPEQIGRGIDQEAIKLVLMNYWQSGFNLPEVTDLPLLTSLPSIRTSTLEELLPQAQQVSLMEFELRSEWGTTWELVMSENIAWLLPTGTALDASFASEEEGGKDGGEDRGGDNTHVFQLDPNSMQAFLEEDIIPSVEKDPETVTITETETGTYEFEGSARFGKRIDVSALRERIEEEIQNYLAGETVEFTINLPINTLDPEVNVPDSLAERGITDLLEFGYTNFAGSPYNRIYNIGHGMEIYNGIIVEQGAEFSFTELLGPVDGAHGWLEELVIIGDETKPEYGGGLCQVSSTMYRAALYVGLPITARKEHSYAVSYYAYPNGYGLDATVYQPNPDLRFLNDTPGDILIQGYTEGTFAYFVMYGANDGRSVQMEGPQYHSYVQPGPAETVYTTELEPGVRELDSHSHTGFQVDWFRTIFYGDGTQSERINIHTYYEARPEKWLEGSPAGETEGVLEFES